MTDEVAVQMLKELIETIETNYHYFGKMAVEELKALIRQYEAGKITDWEELYDRANRVLNDFTELTLTTIPKELRP